MKFFRIIFLCLGLSALNSQLPAQVPISDLSVQRTVILGNGTTSGKAGTISPTQLTANTDDWAPTGFAYCFAIRVSTDASRNLTGIAGGVAGRTITLENVGSFPLVLKNDVTSTAANRFSLAGDFTLGAGVGVWLKYDITSSRWRMLGSQPVVGGTGDVVGPASATDSRIAAFDGTTGKLLKDGGKTIAELVVGPASVTDSRIASFDGTTGKLLKDGGKTVAELMVGPSSATDNALVRFDSTTGKLTQDSNVTLADSGTAFVFSGAAGLTAGGSNQDITLTPSGTGSVIIPGSTSSATLRVGGYDFQSYAFDNVFMGSNAYYNGSSDVRRATGTATRIAFLNGDIYLRIAPSGAGGSSITWVDSLKIVNTDGSAEFSAPTEATSSSAAALKIAGGLAVVKKIITGSTIQTAAPSGGTAKPFKIGNAASVTPTAPNRTIEIEIDGTTYYLAAKTTND